MERHISSGVGDEIWANSVTIDRKSEITMAWDAKYTESGPKALYEGRAPKIHHQKVRYRNREIQRGDKLDK